MVFVSSFTSRLCTIDDPRCFMTTDAIYNDAAGAVKYHFVISQVRCVAWARLALRLLLGC